MWVRLLSLIFLFASIPVLYNIGQYLSKCNPAHNALIKEWGFWLIIITLLSPITITIAIEIREYTLLWLCLTMQFLYFLKIWYEPNKQNILLYSAVSFLAFMSHYSAVFNILILGCMLLYKYSFIKLNYRIFFSIAIVNVYHIF